MRILLVEDELKTGNYLKQGLSEAGFTVDLAVDGWLGLELAMNEDYELMIFDVMLPHMNGWEILKRVRIYGKTNPVLFLTASDQVEDRVKGFDLGADDYLIKPFAFAELLARIKNLLRRTQQREDHTIRIADIELDLRKRRVTRAGQKIDLTAKEFALMELFMRRQGEILPRSLIASLVWDMNFESDTNVVEVAIKRLRNKIDYPNKPKLIQNVRGMGYVLELTEEATEFVHQTEE